MRTRTIRTGLVALAIVATACGGNDDGDGALARSDSNQTDRTTTSLETPEAISTTTLQRLEVTNTAGVPEPPSDINGFRAQPVACGAEQPPAPVQMTFDAPNQLGIDPASRPTATIVTSCGDIVVELDPAAAPETVNSFVFLAESSYFDGTVSHRILPGFVIQAGDPTATGLGRPGYIVPDELPDAPFVYERGMIAMANAGPGTTGSQFFLMLDDSELPPQFSVFGRVVAGLEVMDLIADVPLGVSPRGEQSVPLESVFIETISVDR